MHDCQLSALCSVPSSCLLRIQLDIWCIDVMCQHPLNLPYRTVPYHPPRWHTARRDPASSLPGPIPAFCFFSSFLLTDWLSLLLHLGLHLCSSSASLAGWSAFCCASFIRFFLWISPVTTGQCGNWMPPCHIQCMAMGLGISGLHKRELRSGFCSSIGQTMVHVGLRWIRPFGGGDKTWPDWVCLIVYSEHEEA